MVKISSNRCLYNIIWNLFQLLGLFTCCKLANSSSSLKRANNVPKLPGVDYVGKNWALAMILKALPLVHFLSLLLLKEQMITSVRNTLKTLVWSAQHWSISSKICLENNHKIGRFLPIAFWWSLPKISCEIGQFSREFVPKNPAKCDFFLCDLSESLYSDVCQRQEWINWRYPGVLLHNCRVHPSTTPRNFWKLGSWEIQELPPLAASS